MNKNKRNMLKGLAVGSVWVTPVVNSVMLPAHANTTTTADLILLSWVLTPTTLVLDGSSVSGEAMIENTTSAPIGTSEERVILQAWVTQGSAIRAGGGSITVGCSAENGVVDPGPCTLSRSVSANNGSAGEGTLVPGSAMALLELKIADEVVDTLEVPVTLVNS